MNGHNLKFEWYNGNVNSEDVSIHNLIKENYIEHLKDY